MHYAKYIGAILGFMIYGFWGGVFGFFLGAYAGWMLSGGMLGDFGRISDIGKRAPGLGGGYSRAEKQAVFLKAVFTLMGHLAKSDGRINEQEIAHTEKFMRQLGMTKEHRLKAIALFKEGAEPAYNINVVLDEFNTVCGRSMNMRQLLLVYVLGVALADGVIHPEEDRILRDIAFTLGFPAGHYERILSMLRAQSHFSQDWYQQQGGGPQQESGRQQGGGQDYSQGYGRGSAGGTLSEAYQALGVSESDSDSAIKRAYRRLVKEYHPDRLIGQGVPEDMIKEATRRSQEIQVAYDLIKKHRGFK